LLRSVAARSTSAAGAHSTPISDGRAAGAAAWTTVVNTCVVLTCRCSTSRTACTVAVHVGTNTLLGTAQAISTRPPAASRPAAVYPVSFFDLVRSAAVRRNVKTAANISVTTRFDITDALETLCRDSTGNNSSTSDDQEKEQ